jgi:hypothetical protein
MVIAITIVAILLFLGFAGACHAPSVGNPNDGGDVSMYRRTIDDMRQGKDYYAAAQQELLAGHYGMQSVFNWRTPALTSFLAWFPNVLWPQALFIAITVAAAALACKMMSLDIGRFGLYAAIAIEVLCLALCAPPGSIVLSEIPTGVLILLSASAYGIGQRKLGFGAGVLALFVRELAAPYALVCAFLAWRERRYGELAAWLAAFVCYLAYFLWHYHMVQLHLRPADSADPAGWLQFGGPAFVLSTASFNGLFLVAPMWVSALLLPLGYLGLLAWPRSAGRRIALAVTAYLVIFAVVGKPYDNYWGALYTPLLSLGLIWAPAAVRDLWNGLRSPAENVAIAT